MDKKLSPSVLPSKDIKKLADILSDLNDFGKPQHLPGISKSKKDIGIEAGYNLAKIMKKFQKFDQEKDIPGSTESKRNNTLKGFGLQQVRDNNRRIKDSKVFLKRFRELCQNDDTIKDQYNGSSLRLHLLRQLTLPYKYQLNSKSHGELDVTKFDDLSDLLKIWDKIEDTVSSETSLTCSDAGLSLNIIHRAYKEGWLKEWVSGKLDLSALDSRSSTFEYYSNKLKSSSFLNYESRILGTKVDEIETILSNKNPSLLTIQKEIYKDLTGRKQGLAGSVSLMKKNSNTHNDHVTAAEDSLTKISKFLEKYKSLA